MQFDDAFVVFCVLAILDVETGKNSFYYIQTRMWRSVQYRSGITFLEENNLKKTL